MLTTILFCIDVRGNWVDAPLAANQYKSGYNILVIVSRKEVTDRTA